VIQPTPFLFQPQTARLECSAFSTTFKILAVTVVAAALGWTWQMWAAGTLVMAWGSSGWLGAALCMMLYTVWWIIRGRTVLDTQSIEQSWVWKKRVVLSELAYAKLIRVQGLEWLIAPRLYTKTFSNKLSVFYAADPSMLREFQRLSNELQAYRLQH
jgi:hypothetical protein